MSLSVSPQQGHAALATPGVKQAPVLSSHSSHPILESRFKGPFVYNETDDERKKREDDEEKKSNFKKVQEKAEREEAARKAAEAELETLRKEKATREENDKKAADAKLLEEKKYEELARQKESEAATKTSEAEAALKRAEAAEAKVKAFEDQQEAELAEVVKQIPDDKKPPLDPSDPVSKRLSQARYALSLIKTGKPPIGGGVPKGQPSNADRLSELKKKGLNAMTPDEAMEYAELNEQ